MKDFSVIMSYINELQPDIKAEVVMADLLENGLNPNDLAYIPEGTFKRKYRKDILHAALKKLGNGQEIVAIHTSRDGLYDCLPEGLFHLQPQENQVNGHDMAVDSKKQKQEEKAAREFFLPFENEIFLQRVFLEIEERKVLHEYSEKLFGEVFPRFWNIPDDLLRKYVSRLMFFLHFAHQITADMELTARCLEVIIEEKVRARPIISSVGESDEAQDRAREVFKLGGAKLGSDTICGMPDQGQVIRCEFVIGPLKNTSLEDYFPQGQMTRFMECFFGYFLPLEMEGFAKIEVDKQECEFILGGSGEPIHLGYNAVI